MLNQEELAELRRALEEYQRRHFAATNEALPHTPVSQAHALWFFDAAHDETTCDGDGREKNQAFECV
jgi:hypothetical protein